MSMMTGNSTATNKLAGAALILGVIFLVVGSLFTPGSFFIDPIDQTDFA